MMKRYMLYQIAYALWKFLQGKDIPWDDRMQAEQEMNLASYSVMKSIQYRGRHHAQQE